MDLSNGDFQGADFRRADLSTADLTNANLSNADSTSANFSNADLTGANLSNADLTNAVLNQAILNGTTLTTGTVLPDGTHWTDETDMARFTQEDHSDSWRSSDPRSPAFYGFDNVSRVVIHALLETLETVVATISSPFEPRDLEEWQERERLLTNAIVDRQADAVPPLLEALQQALQRYHDHWNQEKLENVMAADRTGFASFEHAVALGRVNRTIKLLGMIGDARAVPVLIDLLGSSNSIIQRAASAALSNIDSPLVASVGAQMETTPLSLFRRKLQMFLTTGRADANFMERLDTIAERKATDGRQVALALSIRLSANVDQITSLIGTIVELTDEEVVYLAGDLGDELDSERAKSREVVELIDRLHTDDISSKQSALRTLRDNGWLTDGSLRHARFGGTLLWIFMPHQDPLKLPSADLQDADLRGATLVRANLEEVNLKGANLEEVNLYEANVKKANLVEAILKEARLVRATLSSTDLSRADLSLADCSGADLSNTNLTGAKMKGTKGSKANLQGANLQQACLEFARILETAIVDSDTILPDGTQYDPALGPAQFKRFTDPEHPDFWRPEPGSVWWYLNKQSDK